MEKNQLFESIETRLTKIYAEYAIGNDVAPATLFRTEGFIEAACLSGLVNEREVLSLMERLQNSLLGFVQPQAEAGRLAIHSTMKRAPVCPSTK